MILLSLKIVTALLFFTSFPRWSEVEVSLRSDSGKTMVCDSHIICRKILTSSSISAGSFSTFSVSVNGV